MSALNARYSQLQSRSLAFCNAFLRLQDNPPGKILFGHFTTTTDPKITEHGPSWASSRLPFLGKTFSSRDECLEYFKLLAETLKFIPNKGTFPSKEWFIVVDKANGRHNPAVPEKLQLKGQVSVVRKATFKAVKTGKSWEEEFVCCLSEFGEDRKIGHWEIWAERLGRC
ncbi:hypothetical protein K431DRAFT_323634 [Polychaeton citri CBS 116435]|uniref:Uncharacterized protein n=1 Tax=Polychaeton citri CBS 116435 TaxID=1314669 RepID=A0A9P4PZN5_9PEZI|nr:hypothetical protein K431DRAFT_323634 [Polychaeton citri CBS 116435]